MDKLSNVKLSISYKFKVRDDVFRRGLVYSAGELIDIVRNRGWLYKHYTLEQNKRMVRSAIREAILTNRAIRGAKRGQYIFI